MISKSLFKNLISIEKDLIGLRYDLENKDDRNKIDKITKRLGKLLSEPRVVAYIQTNSIICPNCASKVPKKDICDKCGGEL